MKKLALLFAMAIGIMLIPITSNAAPSVAPLSFAQTDGDVITGVMVTTPAGRALAIGGNFRHVIEPSGRSVAALNFAIVNAATGAVIHAGNSNSFIKAMVYRNNVLYVGGSFTNINGVARNKIAAISTVNYRPTSFYPTIAGTLTSLAIGRDLYVGTSRGVNAYNGTTNPWNIPTSGGPVMTILVSPDQSKIVVGGLFDNVGTLAQHGLFQVNVNGINNSSFKPKLRANTHVGPIGTYNGTEIISLAWENRNPALLTLMVGGAGAIDNILGKVELSTGNFYWKTLSTGDVQGLAVLGDGTFIWGYHRNHGNPAPPAPESRWGYYASMGEIYHNVLQPWNPKLSGGFYKFPDQADPDGANGGVQEIVNDTATRKLYFLGAFTKYNQTCNMAVSAWPNACVNNASTKNIQSIAVYSY